MYPQYTRLAPCLFRFRGISALRKMITSAPLGSLCPRGGNYFLSADIPRKRNRQGASLPVNWYLTPHLRELLFCITTLVDRNVT